MDNILPLLPWIIAIAMWLFSRILRSNAEDESPELDPQQTRTPQEPASPKRQAPVSSTTAEPREPRSSPRAVRQQGREQNSSQKAGSLSSRFQAALQNIATQLSSIEDPVEHMQQKAKPSKAQQKADTSAAKASTQKASGHTALSSLHKREEDEHIDFSPAARNYAKTEKNTTTESKSVSETFMRTPTPQQLQTAVIWSEILAKPRSLRPYSSPDSSQH